MSIKHSYFPVNSVEYAEFYCALKNEAISKY